MNTKTAKRFSAYIIDIIFVGLILLLINYFAVESENINSLNRQLSDITESYLNNSIEIKEYIKNYSVIIHKLDYEQVDRTAINILIILFYFVVAPTITKGKTLGLYINGYKIESNKGKEVTLFQMLTRNLVSTGLFYILISFIAIYLAPDTSYFIAISILGIIQILLVIISCFMIIYRKDKRGLQDILSETSIVNLKR